MPPSGTRELADELVAGMQSRLPDILKPDGSGLWSVCVCGSYVRGDFMDRNSDLDFCLIGQAGSDPTAIHDPGACPGHQAARQLVVSLLRGRRLHSHNPHQFDWITVPWESLPKRQGEIHLPPSGPSVRLLNIFLFDFVEHLLVLWGSDPRSVVAEPPEVRDLAVAWFTRARNNHGIHIKQHTEFRIPMTVLNSIHVAQIVFGERTLDSRRLLDLYREHVPDFPLKHFGCQIIRSKLEQRYPDNPPEFAPWQQYIEFENQLAQVVEREVNQDTRAPNN